MSVVNRRLNIGTCRWQRSHSGAVLYIRPQSYITAAVHTKRNANHMFPWTIRDTLNNITKTGESHYVEGAKLRVGRTLASLSIVLRNPA